MKRSPAKTRTARRAATAKYRARKLDEGWVDLRRYVPGELRQELGKMIDRKIKKWTAAQEAGGRKSG